MADGEAEFVVRAMEGKIVSRSWSNPDVAIALEPVRRPPNVSFEDIYNGLVREFSMNYHDILSQHYVRQYILDRTWEEC